MLVVEGDKNNGQLQRGEEDAGWELVLQLLPLHTPIVLLLAQECFSSSGK